VDTWTHLFAALTAPVLVAEVRETPHVGQIDGESNDREQKVDLLAPGLPGVPVPRQGSPARGRGASFGGAGSHGGL